MKKVKGFTLIELIVVIAIIGILAAILVPAMMGWVMKSRVTTYNNNASELCTQLQIVLTDLEQTDKGHVDDCTIIYDGSTHSLTANGATLTTDAEDALKVVDKNLTDMSHTKWAAKIKDSTVTAVVFTGNDYRNVGGFPVPCTKDYKPGSKQPADLLACASSVWS